MITELEFKCPECKKILIAEIEQDSWIMNTPMDCKHCNADLNLEPREVFELSTDPKYGGTP